MVARLPESEALIPLRIFISRANQSAEVPESEDKMQLSGNSFDSSQNTLSGLIGSALFIALASITFHHSCIFFSISSRQLLSSFLFNSGNNAFKLSLLSPCRFNSIG